MGNPERGFWGYLWRESLVALTLGWDLALPIFGGVLLGYFIDRWLGSGYTYTIGLLIAGVALGYYNLARFMQRLHRREEEEKEAHRHQEEIET